MFNNILCYLAYANLLTHLLSYPKSRDAIASKNDKSARCQIWLRHVQNRPQQTQCVIFFLQLVFFEPFEKVYFPLEKSRPLRTKNSSSAPTIPTSFQPK